MQKPFIEVGRVSIVTRGEEKDSVRVIVDVLDQKRVIIDCGMEEGKRQEIDVRYLQLLEMVIPISRSAESKEIAAVFKAEKGMERLQMIPEYKKIQSEKRRRGLTDFERFQAEAALSKREALIRSGLGL